ncbi:hypothetical protein M501DRAFT_1016906 [Patellaria atrata CBS 101060]|uniref:Uncharacterized protein n=1 Tax=Patellaria atrata CBS 101060 TaxID=1346257 RepID=A0A9P4SBN2_9PEZI|nr:hypothetical protein M501DRAFT_1016906 [Patellaria atrata CBS 101060]
MLSSDKDNPSDQRDLTADTASKIVMAEQITHDVVNEALSMGDSSPIDATATTPNDFSAGVGQAAPNTLQSTSNLSKDDPIDLTNVETTNAENVEAQASARKRNIDAESAPVDDATLLPDGTFDTTSKNSMVDGDGVEQLAVDGGSGQQSFADGSAGSDSDTSKGDTVDSAKENSVHHTRSNSVKKPTSFKSVSVTKNFLAKAATTTPVTRPGDKGVTPGQLSVSAQLSAKPRLVAKSGSGSTVPRAGLSKLNGGSGGPDASKVWNKNRPVPPPPPKQFTDEELKQQYGIHMATRLQADEAGKEAKWADIDDDEDDWAPETVEWMDGTKSSVATMDNAQAPVERKVVPNKEVAPKEPPKPVAPAVQVPTLNSSTKTILKPGALANSQSKTPGTPGAKGTGDKPTLISKMPAAPPAKSPWAPLPPVDKVSPVVPPVQQPPPPRFSQRDPHGFDALPPAPSPAKEIAADDFNRSWREDRGHKELFNSQSGRYEPVNETRRGSVRNEGNFRQHAVLQRPPQNQQGPAEPSAAFQTSRTTETAPWARRRASSNVSGGSLGQGRRMSFTRPDMGNLPLDTVHQRRGSQSISGSEIITPTGVSKPILSQDLRSVTERGLSPAGSQKGWAQQASPAMSHAQPVSPYGSVASPSITEATQAQQSSQQPSQDAVVLQQQVMREKLERARQEKQRRREEEEKEEAAKKERLRLKLAQLAPPLEKKEPLKNVKEGAARDERGAAVVDSREAPASVATAISEISAQRGEEPATSTSNLTAQPTLSPPKPPIPTSPEEVAQYGLMKVHQPHPVYPPRKSVPSTIASNRADNSHEQTTLQRPLPSPGKSPNSIPQIPSRPTRPTSDSTSVAASDPHLTTNSAATDRKATGWKGPSPESYNVWGQAPIVSHSTPTSNVWAAPQSRDRAPPLGNGTFQSNDFNRVTDRQAHQQQPTPIRSPAPGPIAPPTSAARISPSNNLNMIETTSIQEAPNLIPSATDGRPQLFASDNNLSVRRQAPVNNGMPVRREAPLDDGMPQRQAPIGTRAAGTSGPAKRSPFSAGDWVNFTKELQQGERQPVPRKADPYKRPTEGRDGKMGFQSTFKQVESTYDAYGSRRVEKIALIEKNKADAAKNQGHQNVSPLTSNQVPAIGGNAESTQQRLPAKEQITPPLTVTNQLNSGVHTSAGPRPSRFFPRPNESTSAQPADFLHLPPSPPPEEVGHPVFDGDIEHPRVNLPGPKVVVKLPRPHSPPQRNVIMPDQQFPGPQPVKAPGGPGPIVNQRAWQDRFSNLLRGTPQHSPVQPVKLPQSPPKAQALAVTSASKAPLDVVSQRPGAIGATVSLPSHDEVAVSPKQSLFAVDDSSDVDTKTMAEALINVPEFGSRPTVMLSRGPYTNAHLPSKPLQVSRPVFKFHRNVDALSIEPFSGALTNAELTELGFKLIIRLPGQQTKHAFFKQRVQNVRKSSGNFKKKGHGNNSPREKTEAGNSNAQSRRTSGNFQGTNQNPGQARSPRPNSSRNGWTNSRTSSSQSATWKQRNPGVVH